MNIEQCHAFPPFVPAGHDETFVPDKKAGEFLSCNAATDTIPCTRLVSSSVKQRSAFNTRETTVGAP